MFYVYVLKSSKDGKNYIGYTNNLKARFKEHTEGKVFSTKPRRPLKLVYYEAYTAESDAKGREFQLKRGTRAYEQLRRRITKSIE
jgi:putative endonuclease